MTDHTNRKILVDQIVPPGKPWSGIVKKGQIRFSRMAIQNLVIT
jgi:hypothetical protein